VTAPEGKFLSVVFLILSRLVAFEIRYAVLLMVRDVYLLGRLFFGCWFVFPRVVCIPVTTGRAPPITVYCRRLSFCIPALPIDPHPDDDPHIIPVTKTQILNWDCLFPLFPCPRRLNFSDCIRPASPFISNDPSFEWRSYLPPFGVVANGARSTPGAMPFCCCLSPAELFRLKPSAVSTSGAYTLSPLQQRFRSGAPFSVSPALCVR